jgi:HlyD family secretion protein
VDIPRAPRTDRRKQIYIGAAALGVAALTATLWAIEPAAPSVDRGTIWTDSARRGEMIRQVRGPGTLVPENARWLVAITQGRVERIHVRPGQVVEPETIVLELSNPDVQVEGLNAERQLAAAEADLANLQSSLETQLLEQRSSLAMARTQQRDAARRVEASRGLAERNMIPRIELSRLEDEHEERTSRLAHEEARLRILSSTIEGRLQAQRRQVERLRAISEFQRDRAASMQVRAGSAGVIQDLTLEVGQWVMPGQTLARVVEPGRLMAVLRIPETLARDLAVGQSASIDTRNGVIAGRVIRIDPAVQGGAVTVDVAFDDELPRGARPDLSVDGVIEIERLSDVVHVGRPAYGQPHSMVTLWKLVDNGRAAVRVPVRLGRASVNVVEVEDGLEPGDIVILSDLSAYDRVDRIRIK